LCTLVAFIHTSSIRHPREVGTLRLITIAAWLPREIQVYDRDFFFLMLKPWKTTLK